MIWLRWVGINRSDASRRPIHKTAIVSARLIEQATVALRFLRGAEILAREMVALTRDIVITAVSPLCENNLRHNAPPSANPSLSRQNID